jgi:hypothetical protein
MLCIYGSSSWELLYLGRFLWDIVQFWKFFIGFLEVSYRINVRHPIRNFQKCTEKIPWGISKNAQDVFGTCLVLSAFS